MVELGGCSGLPHVWGPGRVKVGGGETSCCFDGDRRDNYKEILDEERRKEREESKKNVTKTDMILNFSNFSRPHLP